MRWGCDDQAGNYGCLRRQVMGLDSNRPKLDWIVFDCRDSKQSHRDVFKTEDNII
jgi:hypothetical protein